MKPFGIYTLANDLAYDQVVALLNSIEQNIDPEIPVCIIPFDDRINRIQQEINSRPNVTLFQNRAALVRWENFASEFVNAHPEAQRVKKSHSRWYGGRLHRRFAAFDGVFEKFVYVDADTLVMKPFTVIRKKLEDYDFVFDDWEHTKPKSNAALNISLIEQTGLFTEAEIRPKLHCSSFWGSKHRLFNSEELAVLQERLVKQKEAAWVNGRGWWDDAFFFNYLTLRCERPLFNFTLSSNSQDRTGNCANADPFVNINQILYNQDGLKPIHRIHYMCYSLAGFAHLCQGEDVDIPHRDVFLHYRFLKQPELKPLTLKPPTFVNKTSRFFEKAAKKLSQFLSVRN